MKARLLLWPSLLVSVQLMLTAVCNCRKEQSNKFWVWVTKHDQESGCPSYLSPKKKEFALHTSLWWHLLTTSHASHGLLSTVDSCSKEQLEGTRCNGREIEREAVVERSIDQPASPWLQPDMEQTVGNISQDSWTAHLGPVSQSLFSMTNNQSHWQICW